MKPMSRPVSPIHAARLARTEARTALALLQRRYAASTDAAERVVLAEEIEDAEGRVTSVEADFDRQVKVSGLP